MYSLVRTHTHTLGSLHLVTIDNRWDPVATLSWIRSFIARWSILLKVPDLSVYWLDSLLVVSSNVYHFGLVPTEPHSSSCASSVKDIQHCCGSFLFSAKRVSSVYRAFWIQAVIRVLSLYEQSSTGYVFNMHPSSSNWYGLPQKPVQKSKGESTQPWLTPVFTSKSFDVPSGKGSIVQDTINGHFW